MTEFEYKAKEMCESIIQHYEADMIYESDPFDYCYKLAKATMKVSPFEALVSPDACGRWQKERPDKPCVFLTRTGDGSLKQYNYQLWRFEKIDCDDGWYLGWATEEGEEWDDISECNFDEYFIIEYYDSKHSG